MPKKQLFFLPFMSVMAGSPGVTFLLTNGEKTSFTFASKPIITISKDEITISASNVSSIVYDRTDVQRFYFEENIETNINNIPTNAATYPVFSYTNGMVKVSGLAVGEQVVIYSLNGSKMNNTKADYSGYACIDINNIPAGAYIISIGNSLSFKVLKR